ncbi:MAG: hypothetical protein LBI69_01715 [Puniceicoccales bacterium]|jgi:hypothetical protein|nr:hypothetical protein [Puniceicoccales bacterium]
MMANLNNMRIDTFGQILASGEKMDLLVIKDALEELVPMGKNESTGTNFYNQTQQKELSINIIKCLASNSAKDTIKQRAQSAQTQLHRLIVETIQKWLMDDIEWNKCKNQNLLREKFAEFLTEKILFELERWKYLQCWKSAHAFLKNDFSAKMQRVNEIVNRLTNTFSEKECCKMLADIESIKAYADEIVGNISADEKFLAPSKSDGNDTFRCNGLIQKKGAKGKDTGIDTLMQSKESEMKHSAEFNASMKTRNEINDNTPRDFTPLFGELDQSKSTSCNAYEYWGKN